VPVRRRGLLTGSGSHRCSPRMTGSRGGAHRCQRATQVTLPRCSSPAVPSPGGRMRRSPPPSGGAAACGTGAQLITPADGTGHAGLCRGRLGARRAVRSGSVGGAHRRRRPLGGRTFPSDGHTARGDGDGLRRDHDHPPAPWRCPVSGARGAAIAPRRSVIDVGVPPAGRSCRWASRAGDDHGRRPSDAGSLPSTCRGHRPAGQRRAAGAARVSPGSSSTCGPAITHTWWWRATRRPQPSLAASAAGDRLHLMGRVRTICVTTCGRCRPLRAAERGGPGRHGGLRAGAVRRR
jgi:hypothetical protein